MLGAVPPAARLVVERPTFASNVIWVVVPADVPGLAVPPVEAADSLLQAVALAVPRAVCSLTSFLQSLFLAMTS